MQWCIYNPVSREYCDSNGNPVADDISGQGTTALNPLYKAPEGYARTTEQHYCDHLAKWWQEAERHRQENMVINNLGGEPPSAHVQRSNSRQQLLMRDVQIWNDRRDYFKCTVKVRRIIIAVLTSSLKLVFCSGAAWLCRRVGPFPCVQFVRHGLHVQFGFPCNHCVVVPFRTLSACRQNPTLRCCSP